MNFMGFVTLSEHHTKGIVNGLFITSVELAEEMRKLGMHVEGKCSRKECNWHGSAADDPTRSGDVTDRWTFLNPGQRLPVASLTQETDEPPFAYEYSRAV